MGRSYERCLQSVYVELMGDTTAAVPPPRTVTVEFAPVNQCTVDSESHSDVGVASCAKFSVKLVEEVLSHPTRQKVLTLDALHARLLEHTAMA